MDNISKMGTQHETGNVRRSRQSVFSIRFSLFFLLECSKYSKMLMKIFRLRVLECFQISSRPEMLQKKTNKKPIHLENKMMEQRLTFWIFFFLFFFKHFLADACQAALNAAFLFSRVFLLLLFYFQMRTCFVFSFFFFSCSPKQLSSPPPLHGTFTVYR